VNEADAPVVDSPVVDSAAWSRAARSTAKRVYANLRGNWKRTLLCLAVGWAIGWLANVWVMARTYDGFRVPSGSTTTGEGNLVAGVSYWFVISMVVSAVVCYRIQVGSERFWADVRGFPNTLKELARADGNRAKAHALFGFAGATLITFGLGPSLSGAVGIGVLAALGTMYRPIIVGAFMLAWRWVTGRVAPQHQDRAPAQSMTVATLGGAAAMALAVVIGEPSLRFLLAIVAVIAAVVLAKGNTPAPGPTAVWLVLAGTAAAVLGGIEAAFGDDGGWKECGSSLERWWSCTGSDRARWLAAFGAGGSAFGAGLGSGLVPPGPPVLPKPWSEMTEEERNRFRQDYIQRFKDTHPNASADQLRRFIEGLDSQPPGFWENRYEDWKNFWGAYWDDVSSGKQAEGLGGMFYGMYEGFSGAASATWDELTQLDDTAREFGGVFWKDLSSGEQLERLKGMVDYGGHALGKANELLQMTPEELAAACDKYGKENVAKFLSKMGEFERALASKDPTEIRRSIGQIAGAAEFEALLGGATDKGLGMTKQGLTFLQEARLVSKMDEAVVGIRQTSKGVTVGISDDMLAARQQLMEQARSGKVKLTPQQADELFGIDQRMVLDRQATTLQYGEGAASQGAQTQYKLGDENAVLAKQLRSEHPDLWTGKWNPVNDKSFVPGEEALMSADDLARFEKHPPLPGETVNYTPRNLSSEELAELPDSVRARYQERVKEAGSWEGHTGFADRKTVDYSDPKVRQKYGEMYVPEDPSQPVKAAEFWKDPDDNRVYVRYQTEDGTWSPPRRQASDVDTVTHSGGEGLTYEQSRDLQYKQSMGQLGEGDTPKWAESMLTKDAQGNYVLEDPEMKGMLYKAIDSLQKAESELVIQQDLDGLVLTTAKYPQLDMCAEAARAIDAQGGWSPNERSALVARGILR
jgi:hypothetical protein